MRVRDHTCKSPVLCGSQRCWRTPRDHGPLNQLSGAHMGPQGLKQQAQDLHGFAQGPLHICYGCLLGVFVRPLTTEASTHAGEILLLLLVCFGQPWCDKLSLCLVGSVFVLFGCGFGGLFFSEKVKEGEWIWGEVGVLRGVEGWVTVLGMYCMRGKKSIFNS